MAAVSVKRSITISDYYRCVPSRGSRHESKGVWSIMSDWQSLLLGDLKQNEFSPKVNLKVFLCVNV